MQNTQSIIGLVKKYMPEVPIEQVREFVSRAYLMLKNTDVDQSIYYLSDNKNPLPVLKIVPGVYTYDITPDNLTDIDGVPLTDFTVDGITVTSRKVKGVFTDKPIHGITENSYYPSIVDIYGNSIVSGKFYQIPVQAIPQRSPELPAKITILQELADVPIDIFVEFWYAVPNLTSSNMPLLIDTDMWLDAIIDGAVGYYEDIVNGKSERKANFIKYHIPKFKKESNESYRLKASMSFPTRSVG